MSAISKYTGRFKPKNPGKYKGDPTNIIYRSFLELKMMMRLDMDKNVAYWSSEEIIVPYISPIDAASHRYFVDFVVWFTNGKTTMIEIKPKNQTRPPQKKSKVTKKYIEEVKTWGVNKAKWEAAKKFCERREWEFCIMTEDDLGVNYGRKI